MIIVPLTQGQTAKIDDEDAHLARLRWFAERRENTFYATRNRPKGPGLKPGVIRMHTAVLGPPPDGMEVDHINGDGLDNRRANLRWVSSRQNAANRGTHRDKGFTRFKGVFWHKRNRRWFAQMTINGRLKYLGQFDTDTEAATAYDAAAIAAFGDAARLNIRPPPPSTGPTAALETGAPSPGPAPGPRT